MIKKGIEVDDMMRKIEVDDMITREIEVEDMIKKEKGVVDMTKRGIEAENITTRGIEVVGTKKKEKDDINERVRNRGVKDTQEEVGIMKGRQSW